MGTMLEVVQIRGVVKRTANVITVLEQQGDEIV
jgi:hypothetical protein